MKLQLLCLTLLIANVVGAQAPATFRIQPKETKPAEADTSIAVDNSTAAPGVTLTQRGMPAALIGNWDQIPPSVSNESLIYTSQGKRRIPRKLIEFAYYPLIDASGNNFKKLRFRDVGAVSDTLIVSHCMINDIRWIGATPLAMFFYQTPATWDYSYVDLSHNQIASANRIFRFRAETLDISHNRLSRLGLIPSNVEYLNVSDNYLTELGSKAFTKQSKLEYLDLSNNMIKKIPRSIKNAQKLQYLDLSDNQIKRFSVNLRSFPDLQTLDLRGNPLNPTSIENLQKKWPDIDILF